MSKRQKFVLTAFLLSGAFWATASAESINRVVGISLISIASVILFAWSLSDSLRKDATLLLLILPAMFTFGVGSFWFLLPSVALAHAPIIILYGLGIYALALKSNIVTISRIRTIALLRAAKSVDIVIRLFTSFLLFDAIFSLKTSLFINLFLTFITAFLLFLPSMWISYLSSKLTKELILHVLSYSYIITMLCLFLFFWPSSVVVSSLLLTSATYVLLGLGQAYHEGRLFKETVREYVVVGIIVFVAMALSTSWRG